MSRGWKPGDVAMVTGYFGHAAEPRIAIRDARGGGWHSVESPSWCGDHNVTEVRPLVVIDPENLDTLRPAVEEWTRDTFGYTATDNDVRKFAAALREFADPKPPPCGASLTIGKAGALYHCAEPAGHESPHTSGSFIWTAVLP